MFFHRKKWSLLIALALILLISAVGYSALGDRTLSRGSRGPEVVDLQKRLSMLGYVTGPQDGIFGRKTNAAVRLFQKEHGLTVDGMAGTNTIRELKRLTGTTTSSGGTSVGLKNSDIDLLAHLVSGEARGEPYRGQIAVAAVVLNRIDSRSFPNSVSDIVYQPGAFSCVDDGQLYRNPTSSSYRAVYEALAGTDPSYGAIYFFNPSKTSNRFIWSRSQILQIGNHIFAR
ncbi:spore cortex-lytic enzyme [Syntrophobotulus glycolicus DSM 8271]|uniref:Spore cortex-lytic enzyme n=1 Tax=Syntrophobotulus glycolicus (strain DSM 8271 / FlGlyR) TaxID=645991 RepID=F0SUU8_SYNGF|nr:spore cortex-lytic enzyme [Syntrophobotulus glycolicus]ADY56664.1 spore cortex-lytic enzyme [Syntrophobotulus glycolicus DSM 8271]